MKFHRAIRVEHLEPRQLLTASLPSQALEIVASQGSDLDHPQAVVGAASSASSKSSGIIDSIVKAPISPDGTVAGAPTDFVINLDISLDPSVPGRTLLPGSTIKVDLPDGFIADPDGVSNVGSSADCIPFSPANPDGLSCSTGVLLRGWPQRPIPPFKYSLSLEGDNTFVYTINQEISPATDSPGLKQVHLITRGFTNPSPGVYDIPIVITNAAGETEAGSSPLHIIPKTRPSINVTSVFNPGNPNTIYQDAVPGEPVPLLYDFLLWNSDGDPFTDVEIESVNNKHARIVQGKKTIGHVQIDAPRGAKGNEVFSTGPSTPTKSPLTGIDTARLTAGFVVGSKTGQYVLTFSMNNGNSVQMFVDAQEPAGATTASTNPTDSGSLPISWLNDMTDSVISSRYPLHGESDSQILDGEQDDVLGVLSTTEPVRSDADLAQHSLVSSLNRASSLGGFAAADGLDGSGVEDSVLDALVVVHLSSRA